MFDEKKMRAIGMMLARSARRQAQQEGTPANEVIDLAPLLAVWQPGVKTAGMVETYGGCPYRVVQDHDSTGDPHWTPEVSSLYAPWHGTDAAHALPFVQPTGAHDAYMAGEYMTMDGAVYRCLSDGTVHDPGVLPTMWEREDCAGGAE